MDVLSAVTVASKGLGLVRSLFSSARQAAPVRPDNSQSPGGFIVEQRDLDGDGLLTRRELNMQDSVFRRIDLDADGFVSIEELNAAMERRGSAASFDRAVARYMAMHDSNLDKRITVLESGMEESRFGALDLSENGYLERSEVARGMRGGLDVRS